MHGKGSSFSTNWLVILSFTCYIHSSSTSSIYNIQYDKYLLNALKCSLTYNEYLKLWIGCVLHAFTLLVIDVSNLDRNQTWIKNQTKEKDIYLFDQQQQ